MNTMIIIVERDSTFFWAAYGIRDIQVPTQIFKKKFFNIYFDKNSLKICHFFAICLLILYDVGPSQPRTQALTYTRPPLRKDPGERWSRVSQNMGDRNFVLLGRGGFVQYACR